MDCSQCREVTHRYIDGELDGRDVAEFQDHVGFCPDCALELKELGAVRVRLGALPGIAQAAPVGFADRVLDAIAQHPAPAFAERLADAVERARLPRRLSPPTRTLAYSALALAAVAIGLETRHLRRSREVNVG
jgi:anti-sigma factor RsiW